MGTPNKPFLTANGIFHCEKTSRLVCWICDTSNVSEPAHSQTREHVFALERFRSNFNNSNDLVVCKICESSVTWSNLKRHAISHKIVPWYDPLDKHKTFYLNHTLQLNSIYYCCLCEKIFPEWSSAWLHIDEKTHEKLRKEIGGKDPLKSTKQQVYVDWISSGIVPGNGETMRCFICDAYLTSVTAARHLKKPQHIEKRARFVADLEERTRREDLPIGASSKCQETSRRYSRVEDERGWKIPAEPPRRAMICNFVLEPNVPSRREISDGRVKNIQEILDEDWFFTNFPKINSKESPLTKISPIFGKHQENNGQTSTSGPLDLPMSYLVQPSHQLCQEVMSKTTKRRRRIIENQAKNDRDVFCLICLAFMPSRADINEDHLRGKRHVASRKRYRCDDVLQTKNDEYYCKCCDSRFDDFAKLYRHLIGKEHKRSVGIAETSDRPSEKSSVETGESSREFETSTGDGVATPSRDDATPFRDNATPFCEPSSPSTPTISSCIYVVKRNAKKSFCQICDNSQYPVSTKKINEHVNGQRHKIALKRYGCDNIAQRENGEYHCACCDLDVPNLENVYLHIKDKKHTSSLIKVNQESRGPEQISQRSASSDDFYLPPVENLLSHYIVKEITTTNSSGVFTSLSEEFFDNFSTGKRRDNVYHSNYIGKRNAKIFSSNRNITETRSIVAERSNGFDSIVGETEDTKQPELKSILDSMASEVSRLFKQLEENKKIRFSDKIRANIDATSNERAKSQESSVVWAEKIRCPICDFNVIDMTALHSHMAQHFGEEFVTNKKTKRHRNFFLKEIPIGDRKGASETTNESDDPHWGSSLPINGTSSRSNGHLPIGTPTISDSTKFIGSESSIDDSVESARSESQTSDSSKLTRSESQPPESPKLTRSESQISDSSSSLPITSNDCLPTDEIFSPSVSTTPAIPNTPSPNKMSNTPRKINMKEITKALDFDNDYIYDMTDKLAEIKIGLKLCLIIDSKTIYCLICRKTVDNALENYFNHLCSIDHCNYLELMEKDNSLFADFTDKFSDLYLAGEYMQEVSSSLVRCLICDLDVANNDGALIEHIYDKNHELKCEQMRSNALTNYEKTKARVKCDWYGVQKYWCVPCFTYTDSEVMFVKHLKSRRHFDNLRGSENYGKTMILDYCRSCALLWYGYRVTYSYHVEIPMHQWLARDGHFAIRDLPIFAKSLLADPEKYVNERINWLDEISKRETDKENRLISDLEKVVRIKFVRARAYIFGSRVSGVGAEDSDIDVFLDCRNAYDGRESSESQQLYFMTGVHQCLSKDPESWDVEELLTKCRIPIIRACHRATGLACDISFENGLAVENTKMIRTFNHVYPSCRKLILILKEWLRHCDLSGSERITSYALYWYVIFYLQKESILPSVATLIAMKNKSQIIAGWETGVSHDFTYWEPEGVLSLKELLERFFTFYADFDFRFDVACPLLGEIVKKRDFLNPWDLPSEMEPYVTYMKHSEKPEPFRIDSAMCIQDPFDLQHNITKAVSKAYLNRFRACCSMSLNLLSSM